MLTTTATAEHGSVVLQSGKAVYTPELNYNGNDTIKVTTTDDHGSSDTKDITVDIKAVNDNPLFESISAVDVKEGSSIVKGTVKATDVDDNSLTYSVNGEIPAGFSIDSEGNWSFNPSDNSYDGLNDKEKQEIDVVVIADDGKGGRDEQTLKINLVGSNDAPKAQKDSANVDENQTVNIDVLANDSDIDTNDNSSNFKLTSAIASQGVVTIVNNHIVYDPKDSFLHLSKTEEERVTIEYTMSDDSGATSSSSVDVLINGKNNKPNVVDDSIVTDEDNSVVIDVLTNDSDIDLNDTLTIKETTSPTHGEVTISDDKKHIIYTPEKDYNGDDKFSYIANDGSVDSEKADVNIVVNPVNDAPIAKDDKLALKDFLTSNFYDNLLVNDIDVDGDSLEIVSADLVNYSKQGTLELSGNDEDGFLTFTPSVSYSQVKEFTYTISDGHGGTSTATVTVDDALSIIHATDMNDCSVNGTRNDDLIYAHDGNDNINAGFGDDIIYGGAGMDSIDGCCGDDIVIGGQGNDYLNGGWGSDKYIFKKGDGSDIICDGGAEIENESDVVSFDKDVKKEDIAIFMDGDDLVVQYSEDDCIKIKYQKNESNIDKIELADGSYLDSNDISKLVQSLSSYDSAHSEFSLDCVNDVRKNSEAMTLVTSAWHS